MDHYSAFEDLIYRWTKPMPVEELEEFFEGLKQELNEMQIRIERAKEAADEVSD